MGRHNERLEQQLGQHRQRLGQLGQQELQSKIKFLNYENTFYEIVMIDEKNIMGSKVHENMFHNSQDNLPAPAPKL